MSGLCACAKNEDPKKVVLTSGFAKDEIFKIEDKVCTLPQMMVYLTNVQNQYESVYGNKIWDKEVNGVRLEDNVKEMVLSKMAQVKAINVLADSREVTLSADEQQKVDNATTAYFDSLSKDEIDAMNITKETIGTLYGEYALSLKMYNEIIKDINPEISDDEARTITVEHILIKTYNLDNKGNRIPYTKQAQSDAYTLAKEVLNKAKAGEDFEMLATEYSDDTSITYSFGKGKMDAVFEEAAFNLGTDEISDIVETEYGYHIIKCISTFNKEVTDENKVKIVEERRNEAFSAEYDSFVSTLTKDLNNQVWDSITFTDNPNVKTSDFFEVFDDYWND